MEALLYVRNILLLARHARRVYATAARSREQACAPCMRQRVRARIQSTDIQKGRPKVLAGAQRAWKQRGRPSLVTCLRRRYRFKA